MEKQKVVLGMSGGVDSSVAALLLQKKGYEVTGVFMKNYSRNKNALTGECDWREEYRSARKIANLLNVKLIFVDYEKEYIGKIINSMYGAYFKGLTPNPDTECNKLIKFPALFKIAREIRAEKVATGHYARIVKRSDRYCLLAGKDKEKDQSYFLYELKEKDLGRIFFPVGDLDKNEVREIARKEGFPNWDKKGTSGICFVGKVNMKDFLKKRIEENEGKVLDEKGEVIGKHRGAIFYTIGERVGESKGIKIIESERKRFGGKKLYVAEKKGNSLIVVEKGNELSKRKEVTVKRLSLIDESEKINGKMFKARIRHLGELHSGRIVGNKGNTRFIFGGGVEGIAEGQAIVFYEGERVVGGGEMRLR